MGVDEDNLERRKYIGSLFHKVSLIAYLGKTILQQLASRGDPQLTQEQSFLHRLSMYFPT